MWEIVLRPEAQRDVVKATRWYGKLNRRIGERFTEAVDRAMESVRENPYLHPIVVRQTRRAPVTGFPYGVYYRIADRHIVVTGCTHHRRHWRHWRAT